MNSSPDRTPTSRRAFLGTSVGASLALGGILSAGAFGAHRRAPKATTDDAAKTAPEKLRVLILGGTGFLGPATVRAAEARGHTLTLFNRGRTRAGLFEHIEQLRGDRNGDLESLKGREWDVVIDNSGYVPRIVTDSATLLAPHVKQYIFISTVSVYASQAEPEQDESAALATMPDETVEEVTGGTYGPLKALCEQAAERAMPGKATTVRPGLIVGPEDNTDRFTYWPVRIARGGDVLCPGLGDDRIQIIDVRDLGEWLVHLAEQRTFGTFNAIGPAGGTPMRTVLETCRRAVEPLATAPASLIWADTEFLSEQGVSPWGDMPAWVPAEGDHAGFGRRSVTRSFAAGLKQRPLDATCRETLEWFRAQPPERQERLRAGISAEREAAVLAAWRAHSKDKSTAPSS